MQNSANPVVSLLIPICNVERYLRECLDSALRQTLRDIEIICINDGSTDSSPDIIREYMSRDPRVKMIDKANSGYGDSMNRGLDMARGRYVGILESDDVMIEDALERLVSTADKHHADFTKANFYFYWSQPNDRRELHEMFKAKDCDKTLHPSDTTMFFKQKPSIWSAVYRRDFLVANGIRFLPTPGASFQDTSFAFKVIASADRAVCVHDPVLLYRQDNESSSVKSSAKVFCVNEEYAEIERWIRSEYADHHDENDVRRLLKFNCLIKYDSYMWNYVRLAPEFYKEFLVKMAEEFKASLDRGDFELRDLMPWKRANLAAILNNPQQWVDDNATFATDNAMGRAKYYARVGGLGVLFAYLLESIRG